MEIKYELTSENNDQSKDDIKKTEIEMFKPSFVDTQQEFPKINSEEDHEFSTVHPPVDQKSFDNHDSSVQNIHNQSKSDIGFEKINSNSNTEKDRSHIMDAHSSPKKGSTNQTEEIFNSKGESDKMSKKSSIKESDRSKSSGYETPYREKQINETQTSVNMSITAKNYVNEVFDYILDQDDELESHKSNNICKFLIT